MFLRTIFYKVRMKVTFAGFNFHLPSLFTPLLQLPVAKLLLAT